MDLNPIDDVVGGIGEVLGGAATAAGEVVLDVVMTFVFGLLAQAVTAITASIAQAMNDTTTVDLDGGFFAALTPMRRVVLGMSLALTLALLLLAVIRSLAAGEPGAIVRAALVDVPAAMFTTAMSVTVAWTLIRVVDEASAAVTDDVPSSLGRFAAALSTVDALSGAGLLGIIFGLLFIIGAILVWLQLLARSALLYVMVVLAPLGFATRAHPSTRVIARRTIEMGLALIVSKFAIAVAFAVGAAAIDSGNPATAGTVDLQAMVTGVAVMLMAAFMPWVIWKVIPVAEAAASTAGVERAPARAAMTAVSVGIAASAGAARLAGTGTTSAAGEHTAVGSAASTAAVQRTQNNIATRDAAGPGTGEANVTTAPPRTSKGARDG